MTFESFRTDRSNVLIFKSEFENESEAYDVFSYLNSEDFISDYQRYKNRLNGDYLSRSKQALDRLKFNPKEYTGGTND